MRLKGDSLYDTTETLTKSVKFSSKSCRCNVCQESFTASKYLTNHVRLKHGMNSEQYSTVEPQKIQKNLPVVLLEDEHLSIEPEQEPKSAQKQKRKGSAKRKSYTGI